MHRSARWRLLLLLIPFLAVLWVPFYNRPLPAIAGFPFFYVWQLGWVIVTAILIWFVHRGMRA